LNNLAALFSEYGAPSSVLKVVSLAVPDLTPQDVLLRMLFAPINPSDINLIEGTYGTKPSLPAIAGNEGVARIEHLGEKVTDLQLGQLVLPPSGTGSWQQWVVCSGADCLKLPATLKPEQAAMLYVNPSTAWRLLHDFFQLEPGEWVIQNSANSAVGRSVIQIAHALGLRTVNLVRRTDLFPELKELGADAVFLDTPDSVALIRDLVGAYPPRLALNAVGGDSVNLLCKVAAPSAKIVTYGAMSKQPLRLGNGLLIFKDISFHGYWISRWYKNAKREEVYRMFDSLAALEQQGRLKIPIAATYPLSEVLQAITAVQGEKRRGKILLQL